MVINFLEIEKCHYGILKLTWRQKKKETGGMDISYNRHVTLSYLKINITNKNISNGEMVMPKGANPQRVSTEIIIEIKQLNSGRMASQASIESIWCTH